MLAIVGASTGDGLAAVFAALSQRGIGGILVGTDPFFFMQRDRLVALAERHAVPTMYFFREFVAAGGLISFGTIHSEGLSPAWGLHRQNSERRESGRSADRPAVGKNRAGRQSQDRNGARPDCTDFDPSPRRGDRVRRRELSVVLGLMLYARGLSAQQKAIPVIGYLSSAVPNSATLKAFHQGLAEGGYYEGQNVSIEYRWAEGRYERLSDLAADLVRRRVDVIVATGGGVSGRVAKAATNTIPIVMLGGGDFIAAGLASSLSHPGGNVTGLAQLLVEAEAKRLQLLHELVPDAKTIAYLENPTLPNSDVVTRTAEVPRALSV